MPRIVFSYPNSRNPVVSRWKIEAFAWGVPEAELFLVQAIGSKAACRSMDEQRETVREIFAHALLHLDKEKNGQSFQNHFFAKRIGPRSFQRTLMMR